MNLLALGLLLFLVPHSLRSIAPQWRAACIGKIGEGPWKALVSLISLAGVALIVYGFALARPTSPVVWTPPLALRPLIQPLTLVAFILAAAAYTPRSRLRAAIGHPLTLALALWAAGHLLANGSQADVTLFGMLLLWAALEFVALRQRDRREARVRAGIWSNDLFSVVIGSVAWYVFATSLHETLIGVPAIG